MSSSTTQMRICVFCSTQNGIEPSAAEAARQLAQIMHENDVILVYGGGTTGLMGTLAAERVRLGGIESVIGIIPYGLIEREREPEGKAKDSTLSKLKNMLGNSDSEATVSKPEKPHALVPGWTDAVDLPPDAKYGQIVGVPSLTRRKALMMDLVKKGGPGSGFLALPGGFGSLDEVLEVLTHRQLNAHAQQMVLVNVDGFWDGFGTWIKNASEKGFIGEESRSFVDIVDSPGAAMDLLLKQRAKAAWRLPATSVKS